MGNTNFYQRIKSINQFSDFFLQKNQKEIPDDWWVVVTDVVNSTKAIEEGRYKDVNIAGGLAVMAISNTFKNMDFPFIFGGDGATCLIPAVAYDDVCDVIYDTKLKVQQFFDMDLRVGVVSVKELYQKGHRLFISKVRISEHYEQAILAGSGLDHAEELIKQKIKNNSYLINKKGKNKLEADFTGFTCRWQDIPSRNGETLASIIKVCDYQHDTTTILNVLQKIDDIFGDESDYHPIPHEQLELSQSENYLSKEAVVHSQQKKGFGYFLHLTRIKMEALFTTIALRLNLNLKVNWYNLRELKLYQALSSDYKKFDGSLKMVISCTTSARKEWEAYLEELRKTGKIFYGLHVSDRALMTCLLHAESKHEVHFVDGADGGYALAAKQLKRQIRKSNLQEDN